jgi:hypothetical protein
MKRLTSAWTPVLLGAILMATLVGVAGAVPTEKPSGLSAQRQMVLTAADFYPNSHQAQYYNSGSYLSTAENQIYRYFLAPVDFPAPYWVTIDKFELFAYDNSSAGQLTADLQLTKPATGADTSIAFIDTEYLSSDPAMPHIWETTAISPNVKNPANDLYVRVLISDDTDLRLYGVRIWYRVGK